MNIVLLSGGSGKRLWPLSNEVRSKQFLKLLCDKEGKHESMVQRVYRQITDAGIHARIVVATSASQVEAIRGQLPKDVDIVVEPERRNTFPAIVLAASYLASRRKIDLEETVIVLPVDPYVDVAYFECFRKMDEEVQKGTADMVLMGITPSYPSEKYGYILQGEQGVVTGFKEKPDEETAARLIQEGALWNAGVFAFRLNYLMEIADQYVQNRDFDDITKHYGDLKKDSFDYEVVEKTKSLAVVPYSGEWKDIGTWNTLTEAMDSNSVGEALFNETCENVHVVNELDVPIICMGLKDVVVSASPEGILVSDKEQSSYIKPLVNTLEQKVMFADKSWGSFRVLDMEDESVTIKVTLHAGHKMNYHSHDYRDEVWNIISGEGRTIVDGMEQKVKAGDVVTMAAGCRHTIIADTNLQVIEVQLGKEISVHDKHKYELES